MSDMSKEDQANALRGVLEAVFAERKLRLLRYAYYTLGKVMRKAPTWEDAQDLLTSALIEVLRDIQDRPERMPLEEEMLAAWLQRNILFEAQSFVRKRARRTRLASESDEPLAEPLIFLDEHALFRTLEPAGVKTPPYELMLREIHEGLGDEDRKVFTALINDNSPTPEVARRLGITAPALRKRKQRLLERVKKKLADMSL